MNAQTSTVKRAAENFPVRHMKFRFDTETMAKYCWKDDPFSSAFILTFSGLIPHGERLVIQSVRHWRDRVKDPALKARIADLIGQEAMHSRVHEEFNAAWLAKGLPMDRIDAAGHWYFSKFLPGLLSDEAQLAVTCAIEHFTALMAERSFAEPAHADLLDKSAREFLLWHLLEECEHKSVAFDVYREAVDDEMLRSLAMVFIVMGTGVVFAYSMALILATPGFAQGFREQRKGLAFWFGRDGYFARLRPGLRQFHRRDFHPDQINTDAMLVEWREKLFGSHGTLAPNVVKTLQPGRRQSA